MEGKKDIIIVGGGAAGFFCAANLDEKKYNVKILEQAGEVLQKVKISGGGRCNVTHACFDPRELVNFYPRGHKELRSVFSKFQPGDTMEWFENRHTDLKIEDDLRVFPISNSSQSIIDALINAVSKKEFSVHLKTSVKEIIKTEKGYEVITNTGNFSADVVVYTPGSAPKSVKIVEKLGLHLIPAVPSLFTFTIKNDLLKNLPGASFPEAWIRIPDLKTEESGPMLITHWGLSGPAVLKISAWEARRLAELGYCFDIEVNFLGMNPRDAEDLMMDFVEQHPKKTLSAGKPFQITTRFWHQILEAARLNPEKQWAQLSKKEASKLINLLCGHVMKVTGKATFKEEFVTAGGVDLKEIDFRTMQAKKLENFYLAGEVLDIDAVTGGFNFQACWSEGWIIAQHLNALSL